MKTVLKALLACGALAALATGCDTDKTASRVEKKTATTADRIEDQLDRTSEKLEQAGKDAFGGVSYEVAKIDPKMRTVEVRRTNNFPGVTDKKDLQSGSDSLTFTFDELAMHIDGDKSGKEIADELHVGENVNVFFNDAKMVTKITY